MAAASGLERLPPGERDPQVTSTAGTGDMIRHALDRGCRKVLLGIGGSATNDGGMGMASALGVRFLDHTGEIVPEGGAALGSVRKIDLSGLDPRIAETEIRVACDVDNPLTGPGGASAVYGPQKGANPEQVRLLDAGMVRFAGVIKAQTGKDVDALPGAGAAGGLGAGLVAFLGARLVKGFEMVAAEVSLEDAVRWADLVLTGEGRMDGQTRFGKTPFGVAQLARKTGTPVIAVAGSLGEGFRALYELGFQAIVPIQEGPMTEEESMHNASDLLERTGERIARILAIRRPD
jgi:glycerate kinase